jgi:hypothetical protein
MPTVTDGRWNGIQQTPGDSKVAGDNLGVFPLHGLLLKNGKALIWSGHAENVHYLAETYEWDPNQPIATAIKVPCPPGVDIFCCHHALLEDGRVLTVGGSSTIHGTGIRDICVYTPAIGGGTGNWTKIGEMTEARWYPTLVELPDGCFVVFSGRTENGGIIASSIELLKPPFTGPGYTTQTIAGGDKTLPTYPGLHLIPGGKIVHTGTTWRFESGASTPFDRTFSFLKTGTATGSWIDEGMFPSTHIRNREEGMSISLPPAQDGKILLIGGGWSMGGPHAAGSQLDAAEILNTQTTPFQWIRIANMNFPRVNPNMVLLPDGKILVHGGHDSYKWSATQVPSNQAEIYDPVLDTWTPVDTMHERRTYHSLSLLLPDGKVFTAGGVDPSRSEPGGGTLNQKTFELYEPPYFFNGVRPTITNVHRDDGPNDQIAYGGQFFIETPNAASIIKVVLIRTGSMTHHTDTQQRYIPLTFVVENATTLRVGVISDPSVAHPGHYQLWIIDNNNLPCERASMILLNRKSCFIVTDRSHVSRDEVDPGSTTSFPNSFYVIMDGFLPSELGVTTATPTLAQLAAMAPAIAFKKADETSILVISASPQELLLEDSSLPAGVRQRFTFKYTLQFTSDSIFYAADGVTIIERQTILVDATKDLYMCSAPMQLINQPNPYMLDGPTHWLSTDVRVFQIREGETRFGRTIGNTETGAVSFIQNVLADLNINPVTGSTQFGTILTDANDSRLEISRSVGVQRVFNFAIAKVTYRGRTLAANDVRVFFRMFNTAIAAMDYRSASTYRKGTNSFGEPVPLLGINGGEILTIPFFAEARVNTAIQSMLSDQRDQVNRRNFAATGGGETYAFFGCWLDINQTALRFPLNPAGNGPYTSGLKSIQELIRGKHMCLIAELDFAPDFISEGDTPANNDNLSQRNLVILQSDNPGSPATHTVHHTFEIKASKYFGIGDTLKMPYFFDDEKAKDQPLTHGHGEITIPRKRLTRISHDELMIRWGNVPRNSIATIYIPDIDANEILTLANLRLGSYQLKLIDDHTIECAVNDVTYIPLPSSRRVNIAALISIQLPGDIKKGDPVTIKGRKTYPKGQSFKMHIHQMDGVKYQLLGAVEMVIQVSSAEVLLEDEMRHLSVMKHIAGSIPVTDRWHPVFEKYLGYIGERVKGFGGDPDQITASPDGNGFSLPVHENTIKTKLCCRLQIGILILLLILLLLLGISAINNFTNVALLKIAGGVAVITGITILFWLWLKCLKCSK